FSGLVISLEAGEAYWSAYSGGRDLDDDPYAAPLFAPSLAGLPPALVILGGCDMLRDEGRAYAERLRADGVDAEEVCFAGQPHGFVNFGFPAAVPAFERTGTWLRSTFRAARTAG
ncbi:MAG: alpha/beta hydrolase fold domain-containing protein, partial [Acidimicrobiales bacterium]